MLDNFGFSIFEVICATITDGQTRLNPHAPPTQVGTNMSINKDMIQEPLTVHDLYILNILYIYTHNTVPCPA